MFRATTPVHEFIFYEDPSDYVKILITYTQRKRIILEKTKNDLAFETRTSSDGNTQYIASLQLSQEETKMFHTSVGEIVEVQVRVLDSEGNAYASEKQMVKLKDVFNDETLMISQGEVLNVRLRIIDDDETVYANEIHTIQLRRMFNDAIWSEVSADKKNEAKLEVQFKIMGDEGQVYASDVHLVPLSGVLTDE